MKFFLFNDRKNRFCLVAGIKNGSLKIPFSAPFGCFSSITKKNKIINFHLAIKALEEWSVNENLNKIEFNLPPHFYAPKFLTKLYNSLYCSGFFINDLDINYEYKFSEFSDNYEMSIDPKAKAEFESRYKKRTYV